MQRQMTVVVHGIGHDRRFSSKSMECGNVCSVMPCMHRIACEWISAWSKGSFHPVIASRASFGVAFSSSRALLAG